MRKLSLTTERQLQVILTLNVKQVEALNMLVEEGFHGNSTTACATRLLDESLIRYAEKKETIQDKQSNAKRSAK